MSRKASGAPTSRSDYWDNIKGILMLLTVFAHILFGIRSGPLTARTVVYIYMFHMPAFVFVSGYFGKSERSRSAESIMKLVFLYMIFNSLMGFIYGFESMLEPVNSYWYLLALIFWRLSAHRIAQFPMIQVILLALTLFAGFESTIDNHFAAARIIAFYPYYMFGYLLSKEKNDKLTSQKWGARLVKGLLCIAISAPLMYFSNALIKFSDFQLSMSTYFFAEDCIGRLCLIIISFLMIYALRALTPDKRIPLLTSFGRNSLAIFILHRPITMELGKLIATQPQWVKMLLSAIFTLLICLLAGNSYVTRFLDKFAAQGAELFDGKGKKKFNLSAAAFIAVVIGFVVLLVIDAYDGFDPDELSELRFGRESGIQMIE